MESFSLMLKKSQSNNQNFDVNSDFWLVTIESVKL